MSPKQREIAYAASVSVSTVSRVLRGDAQIGERTRLRVLRAAADLGYMPLSHPRAGHTLQLHVLFARLSQFPPSDAFFGEVLHGIMEEAALLGHTVHYSEATDAPDFTPLRGRDAVIVAGLPLSDEMVRLLRSLSIPVVFIGRHQRHMTSNAVLTDNLAGAELATLHLVQGGARRIGFLSPDPTAPVYADRLVGYQRVLADHRLRPELILHGEASRAGGASQAAALLRAVEGGMDALFCAHDLMAVGALQALERLGLAVPGQLQLVGYSDVAAAGAVHLTTVHVPRRRLGRNATRLAAGLATGALDGPVHWTLPPSLVVRETTRAGGA